VYVSPENSTLRRRQTLRAFPDPLAAPLSAVARRAIEAALLAGV
jgi:hypothetical protein